MISSISAHQGTGQNTYSTPETRLQIGPNPLQVAHGKFDLPLVFSLYKDVEV